MHPVTPTGYQPATPIQPKNCSKDTGRFKLRASYKSKRIYSIESGTSKMTTVSSIPTKYQTVVIDNSEKRGFGSQAKRFDNYMKQIEIPGPGSYNVIHGPIETLKPSFSKRGTGGLASKMSYRPINKFAHFPAANRYTIPSSLISRKDFNHGHSSMFEKPIAMAVPPPTTPAPNQYDISKAPLGKSNNLAAQPAFLSKTQRGLSLSGLVMAPSPCHYLVDHSLTKQSSKAIVSSFKSKTIRKMVADPTMTPGPAAYDPREPKSPISMLLKVATTGKRQTSSIAAPPAPVFRYTPPLGPGYYNIVDYVGPPKRYISSAVFVSNTARSVGPPCNDFPGPASYHPKKKGKRSFLYNVCKNWVPS
ncbi:O(6)-methylguanine-induced apoptosis 2 [Callorhinchus milii]|uniref:O(6)-methylguanine-induced apoptosis 2 n=1 Tax=Callorhinchus milii TaxID=7868 RepID=UPI001C3F8F95|nr:O(6)-methylguanine-induced apoptosis 2 [Callorhinchus milii]